MVLLLWRTLICYLSIICYLSNLFLKKILWIQYCTHGFVLLPYSQLYEYASYDYKTVCVFWLSLGPLGWLNTLAAFSVLVHTLCTCVGVYPWYNFLVVDLLGQQTQAYYILLGIAKLLSEKFIPIYKTGSSVWDGLFFPKLCYHLSLSGKK